MVRTSYENLEQCDVPRDVYEFVEGDIFDHITEVERCEVVFCFGILYHITDHMLLFFEIAEVEPRFLIIDTNVSMIKGAVIELRIGRGESPPPSGRKLEGRPTREALEAMLSSFGWTFEYSEWHGSGLTDFDHTNDYRAGRRVSLVVTYNEETYSPEARQRAVQQVFDLQESRSTQWLAIRDVAARFGLSRQELRVCVREAERAASRARIPRSPGTS